MNLKQIRAISKLVSFMYYSKIPTPTKGVLKVTDDAVELDVNGGFRRLCINFTGGIYIYNNLPDGYSIKMTDSLIAIDNLLLKNLKNDNILFRYNGSFEISRVYIITLGGATINLEIEDINRLELINNSKTNLEDETLLLLEESAARDIVITKQGIDDDSIRGLYAHKPLADGYTGYYNYHPKENIYMTGRTLTNQSKPVGKSKSHFSLNKNKLKLNNILNKSLKRDVVSDIGVITKPIKTKTIKTKTIKTKIAQPTKKKEEIKITKGGKY